MKQVLFIIAAGLLLGGCGSGSTAPPPQTTPTTAGPVPSTPSATGPIPVTLGTPFTVVDSNQVPQGQVTFTAATVDPKCQTGYGDVRPPRGHYLALSSIVSTSGNQTPYGLRPPDSTDFKVTGADGFTQSADSSSGCIPFAQTYTTTTLMPNSKYKGTTLLDVPDTSGTLIWSPPNDKSPSPGPGWSLKYAAGGVGAPNGTAGAAPTTAPSVWTREEAQQHYLALVAPENADLAAFKQRPQAQQQEVGVLDKVCGQLAADDRNVVTGLAAGQWPLDVKDAVAALITAVTGEQQGFEGCATAQTASEAQAGFNGIHGAKSQANAVRVLLGLRATP